LPSYYYQTRAASNGVEVSDRIEYYSGSATIMLFGHQVNIASPYLENGEHLTKEYFIKEYKNSDFYSRLFSKAEEAEISTDD